MADELKTLVSLSRHFGVCERTARRWKAHRNWSFGRGPFDPEQVSLWLRRFKPQAAELLGLLPNQQVPATSPTAQRVIQKDQVQFPRVYWAWPTVSDSEADAPALDFLASILSDGDASRLQQALVI